MVLEGLRTVFLIVIDIVVLVMVLNLLNAGLKGKGGLLTALEEGKPLPWVAVLLAGVTFAGFLFIIYNIADVGAAAGGFIDLIGGLIKSVIATVTNPPAR